MNPLSSLIYDLPTLLEPIRIETLFASNQPLEVELGSGDGSFLADYARENPRNNFLGVERLLGRLRKLDRKGRRAGLSNLHGLRIESSYFLEYLLPPACVHAIHLYFPDPWPKRKHRQKRLVNDRFAGLGARVLSPGGRIFLRTDDSDYFNQMTEVFAKAADFQMVPTPAELLAIKTDFERDFNARGVRTLYAAYRYIPS